MLGKRGPSRLLGGNLHQGGGGALSALPTFSEVRFRAMREKLTIIAKVLRADDSVETIKFGPRGGWTKHA